MFPILFIAAGAATAPLPAAEETIVVTASREPVGIEAAPVTATIFDPETLRALDLPLASDVLRLSPGVSVASTGPRGTQTQLRIRGAEANHTLLFVDGIRFNDPAAGNEARFELLTSDALSRIEVVRGPQSALWGSEALGGVIAIETGNPQRDKGVAALGEFGSLESVRTSASFATRAGALGFSGSAAYLSSEGIDSFGRGGERDGFDTLSGSLKAVFSPLSSTEFGLVGHYVEGDSEYDGFDPVTFARADTLDETGNRIAAVRAWGTYRSGGWSLSADASYLDSANRNRLDDEPLNRTFGSRFTAGAQLSRTFAGHWITAAVDHEKEKFGARDQAFFGATDQDRSRRLTALVGEWRAEWSESFATDIAVRHDSFSAFRDATTFRATALFRPGAQWRIHASYGEGVAQPTFFDLFGFFPGSFVGNPDLQTESSRGFEAGVRWQRDGASVGLTGFSNSLRNEIVGTFDPGTFLSSAENVSGKSRRRGVELEGVYRLGAVTLSANYTYLDASERQVEGAAAVREIRRPKHSGNLIAAGSFGKFSLGGSLAYVGKRKDTDFDLFPAQVVTLDDYLLGSLRLGYRITPAVEAYARVENAFDADYQDVVGYNTMGRTAYAGLRLRFGD